MRFLKAVIVVLTLSLLLAGCKGKEQNAVVEEEGITSGSTYKVVIVMDTVDDWSSGIRDGFKDNLSKALNAKGASAEFEIFDTELNPEKAEEIVSKIQEISPDLICMINYPTVFADAMISSKLTNPKYRIVSENCIPVRSKTIESWDKPGGNITGVGVFVQMNSPIKLAKRLNPKLNKLVFYSWDQVALLNSWFKEEIARACEEEGVELVEFREVKHQEESIEFMKKYNSGNDTFVMGGVSAYVNKQGEPVSDENEMKWIRENLMIPFISYDETTVMDSNTAGTCVIWYDIGAQLSEKGIRVLEGENPGDIPWDYPRKYNIVLNKKSIDKLNIKIPQEILSAAYKIYTDYEGNFVGQAN